jgi:hypothetical protein
VFRQRGERRHSISLGERNSMPDEKTLPHMKPVVLAKYYPTIVRVFPHSSLRNKEGREPH